MQKCSGFFIFVIVLCGFASVNTASEGERCGQKVCKRDEYCSEYNRICEPCTKICTSTHHNYDKTECSNKCQGYLQNQRYDELEATVQKLSRMVTLSLALTILTLVVLVSVLCFQLYRWKKKKNITVTTIKSMLFSKKPKTTETKPAPASNQTSNGKPDLRLEIPAESTHSGNSPVTVTTSISRRPAEDSTLDYAYDNPAMSSSPNNRTNPNAF